MNSSRIGVGTSPPGDNAHHAVAAIPSVDRGRSIAVIVKLSGYTSPTLTETVTPPPAAALPRWTALPRISSVDSSTVAHQSKYAARARAKSRSTAASLSRPCSSQSPATTGRDTRTGHRLTIPEAIPPASPTNTHADHRLSLPTP